MNLAAQLKAARRVSVPIVAIATCDPAQTIKMAADAVNGDAPKLVWDCAEGLKGINDTGKAAASDVMDSGLDPTVGNPMALFVVSQKLAAKSVLFVHMSNRFMTDAGVLQALWNLRDVFKTSHRMVVLLGASFQLPPELTNDVLLLDEPLPTPEELHAIVDETTQAAELECDGEVTAKAVEAVQGLSAFAAEQSVAMSLSREGINLDDLWERKRKQIEQTPGLTVYRGADRFDEIGGVSVVKDYMKRLMTGRAKPSAICWLDELEKAMAGAKGDTSGISQDFLGTLLSFMEDHKCYGIIFNGPPGVSKSQIAKASGPEFGVPTIRMDMGGMKGSLVGSSEKMIRDALKVITAVSNDNCLFIATCNSIANLDTALLRRFPDLFYFDLPDREEKDAIWPIWRGKYELPKREKNPADEGWVGANIQKCCEKAWRLNCTLAEAAQYIVPVGKSAAKEIEILRQQADQRFLSASRPGVYRKDYEPAAAELPRRRINVEG